jgi:Ca2+-binding EF-hand superfamily protein
MMNAFRFFDKDSSGLIDEAKIRAAASEMGMSFTPDEVKKLIEDLDDDKDGFINWK